MAFTRRETAILLIGDFVILVVSLWAALFLRNLSLPATGYFEANLVPFLPVFLLSLAVFYIAGLYEKQTRATRRVIGGRILEAQAANVVIAALLFFVFPLTIAPKTILALYLLISVIAISFWRLRRMRRELKREERVSAVLVGRGAAMQEIYEEVNGNGSHLVHFTHLIDPSASHEGGRGLATELSKAITEGVRIVVLDTRDPIIARDLPALYGSMLAGVTFLEFVTFYESVFDRVPLAHVDHAWLLECLPKGRALYDVAKRAFDVVGSIIGLVVAAPFVLVAAILLLLSGGPAFIRNERIGLHGKSISIWKLRTMLYNDHGDPELRSRNRVTRLGAFLRTTRIDELPQLWNVFKGDLSFIGPRPELPVIAEIYTKEIPYYQLRHLIPPGLSGWAQIRDYDAPKGAADIERTRTKLSYDLYYLKHRSFGLDLVIALKTLRALASFSGK